tara:strand:- start:101 stop:304 length:204 start_codon:yes stop_codon:yes gene_type:complete
MIVIVVIVFSTLFITDNQEFLNKAEQDIKDGYTWHYVGPQPIDPKALSIPLETEGYQPHILFKLKKD